MTFIYSIFVSLKIATELEALKERFVKHAFHTTKPKMERVVNLNIICKETTKEGKEELKADVIPVTLGAERLEEAIHAKPGMFGVTKGQSQWMRSAVLLLGRLSSVESHLFCSDAVLCSKGLWD